MTEFYGDGLRRSATERGGATPSAWVSVGMGMDMDIDRTETTGSPEAPIVVIAGHLVVRAEDRDGFVDAHADFVERARSFA